MGATQGGQYITVVGGAPFISVDGSNNLLIGGGATQPAQILVGVNAGGTPVVQYVYMGGFTATYIYGGDGATPQMQADITGVHGTDVGGTPNTFGQVLMHLASDFTSTTSLSLQATNLSLSALANDLWQLDFAGVAQAAANTSGVAFGIAIPAGSTIVGAMHAELGTGLNTYGSSTILSGSAATQSFGLVSNEQFGFWGSALVTVGATPGSITLLTAPGAAAAIKMKAGSWLRGMRSRAV